MQMKCLKFKHNISNYIKSSLILIPFVFVKCIRRLSSENLIFERRLSGIPRDDEVTDSLDTEWV